MVRMVDRCSPAPCSRSSWAGSSHACSCVVRRAGRESAFAFGPWMILGAALATAAAVSDVLTGTLLP
nr:hypothetical protein DA06_24435 [Georgenia sp. SUBG003]